MTSIDNSTVSENAAVAWEFTITDLIGNIKQLCKLLGLNGNVESLAISNCESLFRSFPDDMKSNGLNWTVCLIYMATVDRRLPYGLSDPQTGSLENMSITVTELLKAANVRVAEFCERMKMLRNCWTVSEVVLHHLRQVEIKYLISCPLFDKFERMFNEIFDHGDASNMGGVDGFSDRKQFCWTLFVYVRAMALTQNKGKQELVLAFHLLLCCLEYIIRLTPSFQLRSPFDAVRILVTTSNADGDILKELCIRYQANVDEVKLVQCTYFDQLVQDLPQADGVIDVKKVISEYITHYRSAGDINELDFLAHERYLSIANPRSEVNNNGSTTASTPTNQSAPMRPNLLTPVRAAMNSIQHLVNILQNSADLPSPVLGKYLEKCSNNPLPLMMEQLQNVETLFLTNYMKVIGEKHLMIAQQRFKLAKRLYFHIMESMLKMEEERLSSCDFNKLLNQVVFHKSLITCSLEVVLITYEPQVGLNIPSPACTPGSNSQSILFPWILLTSGVHAFDFFKVIESFLKAEPRLPPEIVKHLHQVENQILECRAWKTGSPVLDLLQQSDGSLHPLGPPGADAIILNETTSAKRKLPSPVSSTVPLPRSPDKTREALTMESPSASPRRSRSFSMFLNKVFKLASQRLQALCSDLHVTGDLQHKIWSCLEYCIVHKAFLLKDRHLDQILMCCIYAISKVMDREIKFKEIVNSYRKIYPSVSQQVFKRVLVSSTEHDSIISFYNKVFMQSLKAYILQYSSSKSASSSPQQTAATVSSQGSPSFPMPGRQNFYVSPMKSSPFKAPPSPSLMTPRTRQLYSFGEGPLSSLRTINEHIRNSGLRSSKRLKFDQAEDVQPQSDDAVFDCEPVLKRRIPTSRKSLSFADSPNTNGNSDANPM